MTFSLPCLHLTDVLCFGMRTTSFTSKSIWWSTVTVQSTSGISGSCTWHCSVAVEWLSRPEKTCALSRRLLRCRLVSSCRLNTLVLRMERATKTRRSVQSLTLQKLHYKKASEKGDVGSCLSYADLCDINCLEACTVVNATYLSGFWVHWKCAVLGESGLCGRWRENGVSWCIKNKYSIGNQTEV